MICNEILKNLGVVREDVFKIVVVLIDGLFKDSVVGLFCVFWDMGVIIIIVGVGCCFYKFELNEMVMDFDKDYVFEVKFLDL